MIHPTAIIHSTAKLAANVSVGAYSIIHENVTLGDSTVVEDHVIIGTNTTMGKNNRVFPFSAIGLETQDKKRREDDATFLSIGDNNIFREYCTVNRGTGISGSRTVVGSHNLFLAYTHIAHDCLLGDQIIMSNNATLAGHVKIGNYVTISGFVGVHQFCTIGDHAFIGMGGMVSRDVPTYAITSDNPPRVRGVNFEGLKRRGFSREQQRLIYRAFRLLYPNSSATKKLTQEESLRQIDQLPDADNILLPLKNFLEEKKRGICAIKK